MAYKIEDIDWDKMPEGATEFSLEDEDYFLTWYDGNGDAWIYSESPERFRKCRYANPRERYKVSDYYPSTNRKPTREERLDGALRALMQIHFVGNDLEWAWKEGYSLEYLDTPLYKEIVDLLK